MRTSRSAARSCFKWAAFHAVKFCPPQNWLCGFRVQVDLKTARLLCHPVDPGSG